MQRRCFLFARDLFPKTGFIPDRVRHSFFGIMRRSVSAADPPQGDVLGGRPRAALPAQIATGTHTWLSRTHPRARVERAAFEYIAEGGELFVGDAVEVESQLQLGHL